MATMNSLKALAEAGLVLPMGNGGGKAGKNCTIQKTEQIPGGNRVTFAWTADDGSQQTVSIDVMDGAPVLPNGKSVEAEIQSINTRLDDIESQSPNNIEYVTAADAEAWFS